VHKNIKVALCLMALIACSAEGCENQPNASQTEAATTEANQAQLIRNQPIPTFDFSMERHMLTEIYKARQRTTATYSVVQSEYTGKVLWSCPSLGYPLPYATQITNPMQTVEGRGQGEFSTIPLAEPNGLYSPSQADATWVPCVDAQGRVTPVYEEKHVTVFLQPMQEQGGKLVPVQGSAASFSIPAAP
jgi:hypothetical protein